MSRRCSVGQAVSKTFGERRSAGGSASGGCSAGGSVLFHRVNC